VDGGWVTRLLRVCGTGKGLLQRKHDERGACEVELFRVVISVFHYDLRQLAPADIRRKADWKQTTVTTTPGPIVLHLCSIQNACNERKARLCSEGSGRSDTGRCERLRYVSAIFYKFVGVGSEKGGGMPVASVA